MRKLTTLLMLAVLAFGAATANQELELRTDIDNAIYALQSYWQDQFISAGWTYAPVPITENPSPECGSVEGNAYFCKATRSISYDIQLFAQLYYEIGDSIVYMILAHEYGHSVASDINYDVQLSLLEGELFADCFAAAFIRHSGYIQLEHGDEDEVYRAFGTLADPDYVKYYPGLVNHYEHGTAFERSGAWSIGWQEGVPSCYQNAGKFSVR